MFQQLLQRLRLLNKNCMHNKTANITAVDVKSARPYISSRALNAVVNMNRNASELSTRAHTSANKSSR